MTTARTKRAWLVRLAVTFAALGLWYVLAGDALGHIAVALRRLSFGSLAFASLLACANFVVGAVRWRTLLRAYGATTAMPLRSLVRLYLVGHFYNTFLPGNVGGDLVRGHVTRAALPSAGAYLVVLLERVFGLAGLLLLCSVVGLVRPVVDSRVVLALGAAGIVAALAASAAPFVGRRLGSRLPGRIGATLAELPVVTRPAAIFGALAVSLLGHLVLAVSAHPLLADLAPHVTLTETIVLVPLAMAATYFPTVAGLGAREVAFVVLLRSIGVGTAEATAASLGMLAVQLLPALLGGVASVVHGTSVHASPEGTPH